MGNLVAIVGRPNVGKSTLFNRLTETRRAIVDETAGVTRDRQYGKVIWNGKEFSVIDTGGYVVNSDDTFEKEIRKQVFLAIEEADAIIFVVDVCTGITDMDEAVADILRRADKKVFLAVNKVDNNARQDDAYEFYGLGLGNYHNLSSINGSGTGDLLDEIVDALQFEEEQPLEPDIPKIAVVGRPNVGKSSLINAFMDEERNIVTDIAGTTRDAITTHYNKFGYNFYLIDTAGIRKKGKVSEDLEFYSVMRSIRAIEYADICILMIDAVRGLEAQDLNIANIIMRNRKGMVVVVNKWDLIENKGNNTALEYEKALKERFAPYTDFTVIFASAISKQRIHKALDVAMQVFENRKRKVRTSEINEYLLPLIEAYPPPALKGKTIKIKYISQLPTQTPSFAFFTNLPQYVKAPYKRFLENKIREKWDFSGVPISIYIRDK